MKVLHVTTHFNVGGISNYILTLSGALKAAGTDVVVASGGGDLMPELARCGIPHRELNIRTKFEFAPKVLASAFRLARIAKDERVGVIHAHTRVSQVAASLASKMSGVPFVTTCHGYFRKRSRGIVDTWGVKVIAISEAVRTHLVEDLGVKEDRVELVYSGVDPSRFPEDAAPGMAARAKAGLGLKDAPVVGTIGRLSSVKGQRFFIEAMKHVLAKMPEAQAVLLGEGPEKSRLEDQARSLGITNAVHFYDSCADTARFLSAMDVFVFPSVKEGLGIALLEALASGRACVASRIGGIGDIIKDGYDGLLVGVGDPQAIGDAVLRLLSDGALRSEMGRRGRALVREKFTLERMARQTAGLYEKIALRRR